MGHTCPIHFDPEPVDDDELRRAILRVASHQAEKHGISGVDYLLGILQGSYAPIAPRAVSDELRRMKVPGGDSRPDL